MINLLLDFHQKVTWSIEEKGKKNKQSKYEFSHSYLESFFSPQSFHLPKYYLFWETLLNQWGKQKQLSKY